MELILKQQTINIPEHFRPYQVITVDILEPTKSIKEKIGFIFRDARDDGFRNEYVDPYSTLKTESVTDWGQKTLLYEVSIGKEEALLKNIHNNLKRTNGARRAWAKLSAPVKQKNLCDWVKRLRSKYITFHMKAIANDPDSVSISILPGEYHWKNDALIIFEVDIAKFSAWAKQHAMSFSGGKSSYDYQTKQFPTPMLGRKFLDDLANDPDFNYEICVGRMSDDDS